MTKTETKIIETYEALATLEATRRDLDKQVSSLKKEEDSLKAILAQLIPENDTKAGITHKLTRRSSVSYAKLFDHVLETYVPKTKQPEAEAAKSTFTTETFSHSFKIGA